jgi:hypothetical protein
VAASHIHIGITFTLPQLSTLWDGEDDAELAVGHLHVREHISVIATLVAVAV